MGWTLSSKFRWCVDVWSHVKTNRRGDERSQITSMGIIDLDPDFESRSLTFMVDDIPEEVVRSERSKDQGERRRPRHQVVAFCLWV
ncbi:hypothetical protein ACOSQ2_021473 [Xanthoceras sorbifolium]